MRDSKISTILSLCFSGPGNPHDVCAAVRKEHKKFYKCKSEQAKEKWHPRRMALARLGVFFGNKASTHEVRLREGIIPRHAQVGVTTLVTRIGGLSFNTCCANSAGLFSGLFCLPRGLFSQRWPDPRDLLWTRSDGTLMGIFLFQGIFVCLNLVKKCRYPGPYSGDTQTLGVCHRHTSS